MSKGITKPKIKIYDLLKLYKKEKILIQPSFQREFVWKVKQQKNLIKSISTGIPLPYFYFAKLENHNLEVIDGQQRLTTIFGYIDPKSVLEGARERISKDFMKDKFKLGGEYYPKKDVLKKFKKTKIDAVIIDESKWDINKKYDMFEILNQGGTKLTAQELRHCVFARWDNELNKYLKKGAKKLDKLIGKKEHLYNEELVLRFFVINKMGYGDHKVSSDLDPKKLEHWKKNDIEKLFKTFTKFIKRVEEIYPKPKRYINEDGKNVKKTLYFKTLKERERPVKTKNLTDGIYSQNINQAFFHLLSYYIPKYNNNLFNKSFHKKKGSCLYEFLRKDWSSKTLTGSATDSPNKIKEQKELFKKIFISEIGDPTKKEPRNITLEEKDTLLENFDYCYLCYKKIRNPGKVVPEHIGPYNKGNMSKFYNILLACKKCNGKKWGKELEEYRNTSYSFQQRLKHKKNIKHYLQELKEWHSKYKLKWHNKLVQFAEEDKKQRKAILG